MSDHPALFGVEQSLTGRRWVLRSLEGQQLERTTAAIEQHYNLPEAAARILAARGYTKESAESFLNPSLREQLPDPLSLKDMDKAIARVQIALQKREKIAIYGDYDVDGATSSAVLIRYFKALGQEVTAYVPDRLQEGYGPNSNALTLLHQAGHSLCITVDCGTTALEPLTVAQNLGLDVVVLDHHTPELTLPPAVALVNPCRMDDPTPHKNLAAVGVCFLFVVGLNRALRQAGFFATQKEPDLMALLDLVALGTVADVVPLLGLNRVFVSRGLEVMAQQENVGMSMLTAVSGLKERPEAWHLGFYLGPRVNAGGRVGASDLGVKLLTTDNTARAQQLAEELNTLNLERQAIEASILEQATYQADLQVAAESPFIMVADQSWHPGVIGIVAGRLKEKFNRPALVLGYNPHKEIYVGSGRSIEGIHLGNAIHAARDEGLILGGGGHMMAAGVSMTAAQLEPFRAFMHHRVGHALTQVERKLVQHVDAVLSVSGVNEAFMSQLARLAPFGQGNPQPIIAVQSARLVYAEPTRNGQHLRCQFIGAEGKKLEAMMWRAATEPHGQTLLDGRNQLFHLAGTLSLNHFQGRTSVQFTLSDVARA